MTKRLAMPIAVGALLLFALAGEARAETVYAKSRTPVYDRPGEMARIVTRAKRGAKMKVLRKPKGDTRWYKVRVNGRTGWVPRSKVTRKMSARSRKSKRKKRRRAFVEGRGRRRGGASSAPKDRVGADTVREDDDVDIISEDGDEEEEEDFEEEEEEFEDEEELDEEDEVEERPGAMLVKSTTAMYKKPRRKSGEVAELDEGEKVFLVKESSSGNWLKVETEGGVVGWMRASKAEKAAYVRPKYSIDLRGNLGVSLMSQSFASDGAEGNALAAYDLNASTLSVALGGVFTYDYSADWLLGADLGYRYGRATPGIRFEATDIPFTTHTINLGARAGYKLGKASGMALFARGGYSYMNMSVDNFDDAEANPLLLPNENVGGFVVGARFLAPKVYDDFHVEIGLDYLLPTTRTQTENLQDGTVNDVSAYMGSARVRYRWKPKWDLIGMYSYASYSTNFEGASDRVDGANLAERNDIYHTVLLGLVRPML